MATGFEELECVICSENLLDPRALPCGHSFCGPPRQCLTGLKSSTGGICCAICRVDHDLKPEDIKPLYGIRECFSLKSTTRGIPCSAHKSKECPFWCLNCEMMICNECFETDHDDHSVRNLKKHLTSKVESLFGKSWREGIANYRESLKTLIDSRNLEREKLEHLLEEMNKELQSAQLQASVIDRCIETLSRGNDEKRANETLCLLNLSNLELLEIRDSGMDKTMEKIDTSTQCNTACCENSTQYDLFTGSVSSQSDSKLVCVNNSTASQTEAPLPLCSTSIAYSRFSNAARSALYNNYLSYVRSCKDENTSDDDMFDCYCTLKHKKVSNWNFTICLQAELHVSQRNPLVIGRSNTLIVCPFTFWIRAELVQHKHKRAEKMFRIILCCEKANEDFDDLPASIFRYAFILKNHNENGVDKEYEGTWHYPKHKELYWHSITYSQLINPGSGWIHNNDNVVVQIELVKLA